MSTGTPEELEEERRLFYVALTRAAKLATISHAQVRYKWGTLTTSIPSRFINEIDPKWIDNAVENDSEVDSSLGFEKHPSRSMRSNPSSFGKDKLQSNGTSFAKRNLTRISQSESRSSTASNASAGFATPENIEQGMQVLHDRFGSGMVVEVEGEGQNRKATVDFKAVGKKSLLLKFAKLKVVG
jgi:DNA helicase-2/ATP-dependent DNA helicase PcrA